MQNNPNSIFTSNVHPYNVNSPGVSFSNLQNTFANPNPNNSTFISSLTNQPQTQYLTTAANPTQVLLPSSSQTSYVTQAPTVTFNHQTSVAQPAPVYRPSQTFINTSYAAPQQAQYVTVPVTQVVSQPVYQQEIINQRTIVH